MKNLLTKTLFISLLLSVVMPSGVQANFSAVDVKKHAKMGVVILANMGGQGIILIGIGVGATVGKAVGEVLGEERSPLVAKGIGILAGAIMGALIGMNLKVAMNRIITEAIFMGESKSTRENIYKVVMGQEIKNKQII